MSYILDALKKADRDRSLGEVPDLEAAHWGVRRDENPRRWLWIVAVLLIVNAGLLAWMLGGRDQDVPAVPEQAAAPPVSKPAPPVREATVGPRSEPAAATEQKPLAVVRPRVPVKPHVAPPAQTKSTTPAARVVTAQAPLSEMPAEGASDIPELGELPLEFRSGFQPPHIDVHVYSEQPRRRFILVDLQKFREGDTLNNGAVLEKINPNSIQLFYQGKRFRVDR